MTKGGACAVQAPPLFRPQPGGRGQRIASIPRRPTAMKLATSTST